MNNENLTRPDTGRYNSGERIWDEILPNLWMGGTHEEDDFRSNLYNHADSRVTSKNFDFVATLYAWSKPVDWFVREYRYGVYDSKVDDLDLDKILDLVDMIHSEWKAGNRVLVRCQAGWNRSGLVMAMVLQKEGYSAREAIALIRGKRDGYPLCNAEFVKWLLSFDETVDELLDIKN
jgi:hypothetical protein